MYIIQPGEDDGIGPGLTEPGLLIRWFLVPECLRSKQRNVNAVMGIAGRDILECRNARTTHGAPELLGGGVIARVNQEFFILCKGRML